MKSNKILLALVASFGISTANAVIVQQMVLKNGTVLSGYIQQQDGNGTMTFHTDKAIVCVDNYIVNVGDDVRSESSLDKSWKDWAEENDAYSVRNGMNELTLNNLTFHSYDNPNDSVAYDVPAKKDWGFEEYLAENRRVIRGVKVLERGVKLKYIELTPNTYVVSWNDVFSIKADKRAKNALSGIDRVYQLKSGLSVEGQYAEETLNTMGLYVKGGMTQTFNLDDVVKFNLRPINSEQDIFEQSELLDIIKRKNGGELRGIIIEQSQTSGKNAEKYFLIKQQNGTTESVLVSNIVELRKEENPQFKPKFDVILKAGETMLNGQLVKSVKVGEIDNGLVLDSVANNVSVVITPGVATPVVVQYRSVNGANVERYQLVKVESVKIKKEQAYGFSYKELANSVRPSTLETSVNHTTHAEYIVNTVGVYALYDAKSKTAITFEVKKK